MQFDTLKLGQKINHSRYGSGVISHIDYIDKGVTIDELSESSIELLNKDRQIKNMPVDSTQLLTRVYENKMDLLP